MKIAITGHRPNKLGNDYNLTSPLVQAIKARIEQVLGYEDIYFGHGPEACDLVLITGMALGIDTLFAQIAIENDNPFIAAIPCQQQHKMWPQKAKELYLDLINHPLCTKEYISLSEYSPQCMQKRNEWMVDNCDLLIAVWDGSPGGTANCVAYAQSINKLIVRINPKELCE